jgi:NADP-dependent 3-hydroxy acid dehydrogenase YdfG
VDLFSLKGKNIAITGASSGFGHHFAGVLADAGARVILGARRTDKISDRVTEINENGGQAMGIPLDVTDPDSCAAFFLRQRRLTDLLMSLSIMRG